jgi:dipeptidyl aminopeptidase/acylaminoacyl peptidase
VVAAVANPTSHIWSVPITPAVVGEKDATRVTLPSVRANDPSAGPGYLIYLSSTGGDAAIWKFENGIGMELWKPVDSAVAFAPAISPDGRQLCFVARKNGRGALFVMTSDGTGLRALGEGFNVQDQPSWSPDGQWMAIAANDGKRDRLFKVKVSEGTAVPLTETAAHYPVWSPDGRFILYRQTEKALVMAVTPEGAPFPLGLPPIPFRNAIRNPYRILPDGKQIVVLSGQYRQQNFLLADIGTGKTRMLTDLQPGSSITAFDVSRDGRSIFFDRVRENADIVVIEPKR